MMANPSAKNAALESRLAAARRELQNQSADQPDHEQAEHPAHELNVEAHVAVQDVTELVADHTLQLVARETIERPLCHGDRRVGCRVPGRKRVDSRLLLEDIHLRHGHAGGDRHLLDHVQQPFALEIGRIGSDQNAAERPRHHTAAAP